MCEEQQAEGSCRFAVWRWWSTLGGFGGLGASVVMAAMGVVVVGCVGLPPEAPCPSNNGMEVEDDGSDHCIPPVDCSEGLRPAEVPELSETTCRDVIMPTCEARVVNDGVVTPCLDLAGRDLQYLYMDSEDVQGSSFAGSDLTGAHVGHCDLREADFSGAVLRDADFGCSDLRRADLSGADLRGAQFRCGLTHTLKGAIIHETVCPDGIAANDSCEGHLIE